MAPRLYLRLSLRCQAVRHRPHMGIFASAADATPPTSERRQRLTHPQSTQAPGLVSAGVSITAFSHSNLRYCAPPKRQILCSGTLLTPLALAGDLDNLYTGERVGRTSLTGKRRTIN